MHSPEILSLYREFQAESKSLVTYEQFETLVSFFPTLLVVASDDNIDDEEWVFLKYLSKFMADNFKNEHKSINLNDLKEQFLNDLTYLSKNLSKWENKFIEAMRPYLETFPELKASVLDTMHLFADASENFSEVEQQKINALIDKLGL